MPFKANADRRHYIPKRHRQLGAGLGGEGWDGQVAGMTPATKSPYAGYRFPAEVISHAVWLYFRFPLSLRMVEEMLAARGIMVSHETVRQWARKFGQGFANQIRRRLPSPGDKWHLDEVCLMIGGKKHWLWSRRLCAGCRRPGAVCWPESEPRRPSHLSCRGLLKTSGPPDW